MKHLKEAPRFDERKELKSQVREICDYLFQLREELAYCLEHIGPENLNPGLRERLERMEQGLKALTEVGF